VLLLSFLDNDISFATLCVWPSSAIVRVQGCSGLDIWPRLRIHGTDVSAADEMFDSDGATDASLDLFGFFFFLLFFPGFFTAST
jgi:hypothetical protein